MEGLTLESLRHSLASRYRIEREIGSGGMATVYLAHDVRHNRKVAIKVLDPELAATLGSDRFLREIETTANLQHPHILPLFDSGEAWDRRDSAGRVRLFYVMPFVEGTTLRGRLERERRLPISDAVQVARNVADALEYAHERGVIHRDIKPENILLQGGHALVADFGIAKAVSTLDAGRLTQTGLAVGTPAYMSPEQALGENSLDGQTDVYSLGCVLFEMLTGDPPFSAATPQRAIARRLTEPAPNLCDVLPDADEHLSDVVRRMLALDTAARPTAAEIVTLLASVGQESGPRRTPNAEIDRSARGITSDAAGARRREGFWIAVLPFRCRATDPVMESLADGLSEEVVTGLSRFPYLRVVARSSTARYAQGDTDVRTVGDEVGARYVIEGSVRLAGSTLRLAVQLVDATTGENLWAENYNRSFSPNDVFALQDDLAERIVGTVADGYGALARSMSEALRHRRPDELSAHEALVRTLGYYERITPEEHAIVREVLEVAVAQAPENADCLALLAILYLDEFRNGFNPRPDPVGRAYTMARRAVEAGASQALPHHALALVHFFRKEADAVRTEAARAIALNPLDLGSVAGMGTILAYAGDWERGCALTARCRDLNPHHPGWFWFASFYDAYRRRDYPRALEIVLELGMPGYLYANLARAALYGQLGDRDAARAAVRVLLDSAPDFAINGWELCFRWFDRELVTHIMDGLAKAGLDVPERATTEAGGS